MSLLYEELRSEVMRRAAVLGITPGTAAMQIMTLKTIAMAKDLPDELLEGLAVAARRWLTSENPLPATEAARVAAWRFLEAKNSSSTTIMDSTDLAVRALICVLWDEADEDGEMEDGLEFFAQLAEQYES